MTRRAIILSLWTLIALPEYLTALSYKNSNEISKDVEDGGVGRNHFGVPGRLFLNADNKVQLDNELDLRSLDMMNKYDSKERLGGDDDDDDSHHHVQIHKRRNEIDQDDDSGHVKQKRVLRRRKGPTLSVVNPLEILRQRLMLDLARRRIHENQQQIVANADFLENLGKRNAPDIRDSWSKENDGGRDGGGKVNEYTR